MPFRTALSGLNAASSELRVLGHNIANASTVGFKKSRTEFADIYPANSLGSSSNTIGSGVKVAAIKQQFTQGNINFTNNNLDLAISGQGFFTLNDNGVNVYTRAGNFGVDNQGYVVNSQNQRLQALLADTNGNITNTVGDLQLNTANISPQATSTLNMALNLDATQAIPGNPAPTTSFTISASTILDGDASTGATFSTPNFTGYDNNGNATTLSVRFTKTSTADQFTMDLVTPTGTVAASSPIDVNSIPANLTFSWDPNTDGTANPITIVVNTSGITGVPAASNGDTSNANFAVSAVSGSPQAAFSATDSSTYNNSTSVTIYDSFGSPHLMTNYFRKTGTALNWEMYTTIDGTAVGGAAALVFSNTGTLASPVSPSTVTLATYTPTNGSAPLNITVDVSGLTQYGSPFSVNSLNQNGFATGRLNGIDIGDTGVVTARYTNGQSRTLAQVTLTNFSNSQGLRQLGGTSWAESFESGPPLTAAPGTGSLGLIQSGAEEGSNVDLTEQLVGMITAQRNFQANAQVITTADAITQTIINIR